VKSTCGVCGKLLEPKETIDVAGHGPRCYPCVNRETADHLGLDFVEPHFQPIVLKDADGTPHTFRLRSMLVPTGHELEALEDIDDPHEGYRFAILGDSDADPWELFQRLYTKMRDEVATRHVHRTELGWQLTQDQQLIGRIEWDPNSDARLPLGRDRRQAVYLGAGRTHAHDVRRVHPRGADQGHHRAARRRGPRWPAGTESD
jgi:hypothetical protein